MRFYIDEDLPYRIASIARSLGVDAIATNEVGRNGTPDEEQLHFAAAQGRCIVTKNYGDFTRLTSEFATSGHRHAGVLFVPASLPGKQFAAIAAALVAYDHLNSDGLPPYGIDYLRSVPRG